MATADARQPLRTPRLWPELDRPVESHREEISRDADDVTDRVAKNGDPVLAEGALEFYTAARYSDGRWINAAVIKLVPHAAAEAPHRRGTAAGG